MCVYLQTVTPLLYAPLAGKGLDSVWIVDVLSSVRLQGFFWSSTAFFALMITKPLPRWINVRDAWSVGCKSYCSQAHGLCKFWSVALWGSAVTIISRRGGAQLSPIAANRLFIPPFQILKHAPRGSVQYTIQTRALPLASGTRMVVSRRRPDWQPDVCLPPYPWKR